MDQNDTPKLAMHVSTVVEQSTTATIHTVHQVTCYKKKYYLMLCHYSFGFGAIIKEETIWFQNHEHTFGMEIIN